MKELMNQTNLPLIAIVFFILALSITGLFWLTTSSESLGYVIQEANSTIENGFCCMVGEKACHAVGSQSCESCFSVCDQT